MQDSDDETARKVVAALDDATLRRLFKLTEQGYLPARMRAVLQPSRLLEILDIIHDATAEQLAEGIRDMVIYPAGNPLIDEPFIDAMYQVIAARSVRSVEETLVVTSQSPFPMERFIMDYPGPAVRIMASDLDLSVQMVKTSEAPLFPPPRFIYRLIHTDPEFAARLVERLDELGEDDLVVEALAHFAYDADRLKKVPDLPISLERDGRFLKMLLFDEGVEWLEARIGEAVRLYRHRVNTNEAPGDFLSAYQRTLMAAASSLEDEEAGRIMAEITDRVFRTLAPEAEAISRRTITAGAGHVVVDEDRRTR